MPSYQRRDSLPSSISHLLPYFLLHPVHDLVQSEMGGVQDEAVCRGHHGAKITTFIALVALHLRPQHFFPGEDFAARLHFALSPPGALVGIRYQKELTGRVREDHRALVAALANQVPT